jgi:hypothetical protein
MGVLWETLMSTAFVVRQASSHVMSVMANLLDCQLDWIEKCLEDK